MSEARFLKWIATDDKLRFMLVFRKPGKFTLTVTRYTKAEPAALYDGFEPVCVVHGSTPSEARARAIVAATQADVTEE